MSPTKYNIEYENLHKLNKEFEEGFQLKFKEFLKKGWYILGVEVSNFEKNFAKYCGSAYCVGVANGLNALEIGLSVFEFPEQSEVIVPSNTYIASILSVINMGHVPILVEPDRRTYNLDPTLIERAITPKTRAIMVVHLYGQPAQMDKICEIADRHGLEIIEDCAQAHGASLYGRRVGTFGKIGAYSFYPTKNLGALGDAGAIITSDEKIYVKLRALRNYGSEKKYYNQYIGYNSRLDELQAAFLNIKLPFLDKINEHKKKIAAIYHEQLTDKVIKPVNVLNGEHVYHIYNIRTEQREELKRYLLSKRIHTEIHYPVSPHKQTGYRKYFEHSSCPISEEIHATTLSIPVSYTTGLSEAEYVAESVNNFFEQ